METAPSQETINALTAARLGSIDTSIAEINKKLDSKYVTREEFSLVQKIVFAEVALILLAFFGTLVYIVIPKAHTNYTQTTTTNNN